MGSGGFSADVEALEQALGRPLDEAARGAFISERRNDLGLTQLDSMSYRARGALQIDSKPGNWQAHHLVPFDVVNKLSPDLQHAIAASEWKMDGVSNLVALPRDWETFEANMGRLPMHNGPHPGYSSDVQSMLTPLESRYLDMSREELMRELETVSDYMRSGIWSSSTMLLSAEVATREPAARPLFWQLTLETSNFKRLIDAQKHDPLSISIINRKEAHALIHRFRHREKDRSYLMPLPPKAAIPIELEIRAPDYAPDYFFDSGFHFISARFRSAASLPDSSVRYLEAPCLRCTPEARAKDYKAMWVHRCEDVLDRERSVIQPPERFPERSTYVFRDDVQVSAPIFQLGLYGAAMLTDEAAQSLAAGDLDGIAFWDMTRYRPDGQFVRLGDDSRVVQTGQ